jgi:1-acyl-sn-glycerol-3-phosphate acyltransferase
MMQLDSREDTAAMTKSAETTPESSKETKTVPVTSSVAHWLTPILYPFGRHIVLPLYFRQLRVTGQEHIPATGSVILAPTHRSRWDGLMIPYAAGKPITGRDLRFMVSADEVKGIQGWFVRKMGGFPVNTKHPGIGSIRHAVELLRNGEALVIFPEGNIFHDNQVHPLKPGMARIALQAQAGNPDPSLKIVPISIRYSDPFPHWGCDVSVCIGEPLNVGDYSTKSSKQSAKQLTEDLEAAIKDLDEENAMLMPCQQQRSEGHSADVIR